MILIDGNAVAARCFYATHSHTTVFDESAFRGAFIKSLLKILTDLVEYSNQVILCIDSKSWRHASFESYKSGRKAIKDSVPYYEYIDNYEDLCARMKTDLPFMILKKSGYEADDLVAYYALKYKSTDFIYIVSSDKDLKQFNCDKVYYYNNTDNEFERISDTKYFLHRLICLGDSSDSIPSIMPRDANGDKLIRFGEKTVEKLYNENSPFYLDWDSLKKMLLNEKDGDKAEEEYEKKRKQIEENYTRNKSLIDLTLSPVHKETLPEPVRRPFDPSLVSAFLSTYIPDMYERQGQRLLSLVEHYGTTKTV